MHRKLYLKKHFFLRRRVSSIVGLINKGNVFRQCEVRCIGDVSSVSPSSEKTSIQAVSRPA